MNDVKRINNTINAWVVIPSKESTFDADSTFYEPVMASTIKKILRSGWNKMYTDKKWLAEFNVPFQSAVGHLQKLQKHIKNGELQTKCLLNNNRIGRASYKGHISIASLPHELRQALSVDNMIDYDIENAHPSILFNICKRQKYRNRNIGI